MRPDASPTGPSRDTLGTTAVRDWITCFAETFAAKRELLDDLDRQSGDGDFGTNLEAAMERVAAGLADGAADTPGAVLGVVATAFMHTGGTSGPLFGMWFTQVARAAGTAARRGTRRAARPVPKPALAGIQRLGGAKPGDKTMVDALAPAVEALNAAAGSGATARRRARRRGRGGARRARRRPSRCSRAAGARATWVRRRAASATLARSRSRCSSRAPWGVEPAHPSRPAAPRLPLTRPRARSGAAMGGSRWNIDSSGVRDSASRR